ncbi:MAG: hypothetical protein ABIH76_08750 [Candidatus Bathyarchaeota archaeon]
MRVPIKLLEDKRLVVLASFRANPKYRIGRSAIEFVIDTGGTESFVGYMDAIRLNLPFNGLKFKKSIPIGGSSLSLYGLEGVELGFIDHAQTSVKRVKLKEFFVCATPKKKQKGIQNAKRIPSVLGMNFLTENKVALHCNPCDKNEMYLEFQD